MIAFRNIGDGKVQIIDGGQSVWDNPDTYSVRISPRNSGIILRKKDEKKLPSQKILLRMFQYTQVDWASCFPVVAPPTDNYIAADVIVEKYFTNIATGSGGSGLDPAFVLNTESRLAQLENEEHIIFNTLPPLP